MTVAPDQQSNRIKLRYAGSCRVCEAPLPVGTRGSDIDHVVIGPGGV